MKKICLLVLLTVSALTICAQKKFVLTSPDGVLKAYISIGKEITYSVTHGTDTVLFQSAIAMQLDKGRTFGIASRLSGHNEKAVRQYLKSPFYKKKEIEDHYNLIHLKFKNGFNLEFRAYNEGIAYRFISTLGEAFTVENEIATVNLGKDRKAFIPYVRKNVKKIEEQFYNTFENVYTYQAISEWKHGQLSLMPLAIELDHGKKVCITEADLENYPGMYLRKEDGKMKGYWATYPKTIEMGSWGNFITVVKERENYLARTAGNHAFPWRMAIVAKDDKELLTNEMIYLLAKPQQIKDTDWIRPGKATWEWWHCAILEKAPFPSGHQNLSTQMYKYYIDFASENKIPYLLVDAGWSNVFNHADLNKNIDIKEVIRYGKEKKVGVWLWTVAATLFQHPHCYLDSISKWGAVGVKIDFFDRDDAQIIPQYENLAKACAERHLMVDFHGCSKPTGLHRAYPNILSYEAIRCAECFKWDTTSNPDYQLQCIFARMLGGGIDYTPGSMRNSTLEKFKPIDPGLPSSLGTRSHELALFVVLSAPFASLCDSPDEYRKYPDILKYLAEVPTSWDQTIPLAACVGEYAVLAKQKGNTWYIGGLNAWGERTIQVDCSFLPQDKKYTIEIFQDKKRSNKNANLYEHKIMDMDNKNIIEMFMASGGGFVMVIREK